MTDKKNVIKRIDALLDEAGDYDFLALPAFDTLEVLKDAREMLKTQDEHYASLVISWLREMALNNYDSKEVVLFIDAIECIRMRAIIGIKSYFEDAQMEVERDERDD